MSHCDAKAAILAAKSLLRDIDADFTAKHGYRARARPASPGNENYLIDHLLRVADRCERRLETHGLFAIGFLLGAFHDLGKYNVEWQEGLNKAKRPPHAIVGALLFLNGTALGFHLAMIVACHHSGHRDRYYAAAPI